LEVADALSARPSGYFGQWVFTVKFSLSYVPVPHADSPVRAALVPWDSRAFGHSVYELEIESDAAAAMVEQGLSEWLRQQSGQVQRILVVVKLDPRHRAHWQALSNRGFVTVEAIFRLRLRAEELRPIGMDEGLGELRDATADDLPRLQEIAAAGFRRDRFHQDGRLDPLGAERRMRNWVANSFSDGEPMWVHEDRRGGAVLGFVSFRNVRPEESLFTLAVTDPFHQASGASTSMFDLAFGRWKSLGHKTAYIDVSSNNLPSLNVALALGFRMERARMTLHWYWPGSDVSSSPST
jgi:RimJ/RimL family protein N-acetyltransferase